MFKGAHSRQSRSRVIIGQMDRLLWNIVAITFLCSFAIDLSAWGLPIMGFGTPWGTGMIPLDWMFLITTGIAPAIWFVVTNKNRMRWKSKHPPGICEQCGYDLRATPERCPECGTVSGNS